MHTLRGRITRVYMGSMFLSLIVLSLVHLGHRLAGAFDINPPKKLDVPEPARKSEI